MKKILILIAGLVILTNCGSKDPNRAAIERQMKDFPHSSLPDIYKSFFQDNFGPGHIAPDTASARAYLRRELESSSDYDSHYFEPAGRGDNYYRVSLAVIADSIVPFDEYFEAFYESIKNVDAVDLEKWKAEWSEILSTIGSMKLNLPDFNSDVASIDSLLEAGQYAYHHSREYNRRYHPHYRLIRKDIFLERIKPLIDSTRVYVK